MAVIVISTSQGLKEVIEMETIMDPVFDEELDSENELQ